MFSLPRKLDERWRETVRSISICWNSEWYAQFPFVYEFFNVVLSLQTIPYIILGSLSHTKFMYLQMLNQINIDNLAIHSGHLLQCLCDRYTQVSEHRFAVVSFEGKNHDFQFYPASVLIQNKHIKTTQFTGAIQKLSTEKKHISTEIGDTLSSVTRFHWRR